MHISETPERITPEQAKHWLSRNANNRKLAPAHVKFLADQMRAGQWQPTPETIKLATSGRLLDGQHRLSAIVESGLAQELYVARHCDEAMFVVLDTGKHRTAADVLSVQYAKNAGTLAAIARLIYLYRTNGMVPSATKTKKATNADVLAICAEIDLTATATTAHMHYGRCKLLSTAEYGFLGWLLAARHTTEAESFLNALSSGANLAEDSPMLRLRRKLEASRMGQTFGFSPVERIALAIKAWNLFRVKKTCGMLTYNPAREEFPTPL